MNIPKKKCEICTENDSKYKCPKCLVPYCSLNCYKSHKETCSTAAKPEVDQTTNENSETKIEQNPEAPKVSLVENYDDDLKLDKESDIKNIVSDIVPTERLKLLGDSEELKNILLNKHLRELLTDLNEHDSDIDKKIEQAMQEPLFQEFSDACLKIVQNKTDLQLQ